MRPETQTLASVPEAMRHLAERYGDLIALQDEGSSYTFRELDAQTNRLAVGLRKLDVAAGDVVLWAAPSCAAFIITYLATAKANLRFIPMNIRLSEAEMSRVIELVKPKIVICAQEYRDVLHAIFPNDGSVSRFVIDAEGDDFGFRDARTLVAADEGSPCDFGVSGETPHEILLTSGTTGEVKAVERLQCSRIAESFAAIASWPAGVRMHQLRMTPQFHMGGITGPYQILLSGGTVTVGKFSVEMAAKGIAAGANFLAGVPSQYALLIESGLLAHGSTDGVLVCSTGGSGSSVEEIKRLQAAFPRAHLLQVYGSTEAGLISMSSGSDFTDHLSSVGRPLRGVEIRIVDADGQQVPRGSVGEVQVRSPFLMDRYFGRPDLTAAAFTNDGFFQMGDLARQDDEGRLTIVGRSKEVIISGGENVYPKEVEDVLLQVDGVTGAAVIAQKHPILQEMLTAVICAAIASDAADMERLGARAADFVRRNLAGYKVPREIYLAKTIPRNSLGKIQRGELVGLLPSLTKIYSR